MRLPQFFSTLGHHIVRIFKIVLFRIESDLSFMRASSLTFQSILTIVPLLAVMFGIAKGFGIEKLLENIIRKEFHDQEQIISYYIDFGYTLLEQAQGGLIAGFGILILLITVMRLLSSVEDALNALWGIYEGRPLIRKASDYLAIIVICPILLTASSSITLLITSNIEKFSAQYDLAKQLGPVLAEVIHLLPYVVSTLLFMIVYIVMPNTHVKLSSSFWAGLFTGCSYQIMQATYISIQLAITNYGAIYGSFAALPLFLMWLYISWLLFLIGAQIVVILQERLWDPTIIAPYRHLSPLEKELALLTTIKIVIDNFLKKRPISTGELAKHLKMSERRTHEFVELLTEVQLTYKIPAQKKSEYILVPAVNPEQLKLVDVLEKIRGSCELKTPDIAVFETLVQNLNREQQESSYNVVIKDVQAD